MNFADFELCGDLKSVDSRRKVQQGVFYWLYRAAGDALFVARDSATKQLCLVRESFKRETFSTAENAEQAIKAALAANHLVIPSCITMAQTDAEFVFLKRLCRHFVALAGAYCPIDSAGKQCGEEAFYFYSAFVCKLHDAWFLVTAGHSIEHFLERIKRKQISITVNWLIDYFGEGATSRQPIPFNLLDHKIYYIHDDTLRIDGAAILITYNDQQLLEANGIKPLGPAHWVVPEEDIPSGYVLLGLPEERTHTVHAGNTIRGLAKIVLLPIKRLEDDQSCPLSRFQGALDPLESLSTVVGMSGGPIFACVDKDGEVFYYAVAIQSGWDEATRRTIYACPLEPFMRLMLADLLSRAARAARGELGEA
jgi:hypothetical protein